MMFAQDIVMDAQPVKDDESVPNVSGIIKLLPLELYQG
jgi:hypothetical protein